MRQVGSIGLLATISTLALACQADPIGNPQLGADVTAPSVPGGLTATALSPTEILVSWQAASDDRGVSQYWVERDGVLILTVGSAVREGDPLRFSITDSGLAERSTHGYVVRAVDLAGNRSGQSVRAVATTYPLGGE